MTPKQLRVFKKWYVRTKNTRTVIIHPTFVNEWKQTDDYKNQFLK